MVSSVRGFVACYFSRHILVSCRTYAHTSANAYPGAYAHPGVCADAHLGAALSAKEVRGVLLDLTSAGTAAERLERVLVNLAYGHYPDIDALMAQQAKEVDPKKREALLHDIQRLIKAKEMIIPTYNTTNPTGVGPRVKESNLGRAPVPVWWSVPYEDVELAK